MGMHAGDITGMRFGMLVVEGHEGRDKHRNVVWRCRCDCGGMALVSRYLLTGKKSTSHCGCRTAANRAAAMKKENQQRVADLTGQRFGRLTVLGRGGKNSSFVYVWRCRCDCGREVLRTARALTKNNSSHCGCQYASRPKKPAQRKTLPPPERGPFKPVTLLDKFLYRYPAAQVEP